MGRIFSLRGLCGMFLVSAIGWMAVSAIEKCLVVAGLALGEPVLSVGYVRFFLAVIALFGLVTMTAIVGLVWANAHDSVQRRRETDAARDEVREIREFVGMDGTRV